MLGYCTKLFSTDFVKKNYAGGVNKFKNGSYIYLQNEPISAIIDIGLPLIKEFLVHYLAIFFQRPTG